MNPYYKDLPEGEPYAGLKAWLPNSAPATSFYGLDRDVVPSQWLRKPPCWWRRELAHFGSRVEGWGLWLQGFYYPKGKTFWDQLRSMYV